MQRIIKFRPAFDRRDPDPKKNYGIGTVLMDMILKGGLGAVDLTINTGWYTSEVQREMEEKDGDFAEVSGMIRSLNKPSAYEIGYHSPKPMYEDHSPCGAYRFDFDNPEIVKDARGMEIKTPRKVVTNSFTHCELTGGICYSDGSVTNAQRYFEILITKGEEALWEELEEYYKSTFGELR